MKYLVFLLLIACGRNETPPPLDIMDSDGDLISNHEEGPTNKYIANTMNLDEIEGVLSFTPDGDKTVEIPFNNKQDLKQLAFSLLTRGQKYKYDKNYFNEWSKLRLQKKTEVSHIQRTVNITLNFAPTKIHPTSIWLNDGKSRIKIAAWKQTVTFAFGSKELQSLIEGKTYLSLSNQWMDKYSENIEKNTYRVLHFKNSLGKIYYVSHELSFEDFLHHVKIESHQSLDGQEMFNLVGLIKTGRWWSRSVNETDKVIIETEAQVITDYYKMGFSLEKKPITRIDGQPQTKIHLVKNPEARLLLKVKGEWIKRHFKDRIWYERHNDEGGRDRVLYDCRYFARDIEKETKEKMGLDHILEQIEISGDQVLDLSGAFIVEEDASGWTLSIPNNSKEIEIQIINNLNGKSVITGLYNAVCERGRSGPRHAIRKLNTSEEARMEISIEALVEKL